MDGTPSANFDTFPAAIMTVFQVGAGLPGGLGQVRQRDLGPPTHSPVAGRSSLHQTNSPLSAVASSLSCITKWMERDGNSSTAVAEDEEFQNSSEEALNPHQSWEMDL